MRLVFRPAVPSDVIHAVPLIQSSGPEAFSYVFDHPTRGAAEDFLRVAFLDGEGEFGYRNHLIGVLDGYVIAAGAAWGGNEGVGFMRAAARQILAQYGMVAGAGVGIRGLRVETIIKPPSRKEWYLAHLGVREDVRGYGIGQALIERLLDEGRHNGFERAALDVSIINPRAQILYERLGFSVIGEQRSRLANRTVQVPSHRRMELAL